MKKLADILEGIDYTATLPVDNFYIDNISFDSRKVLREQPFYCP
ncbi:MAG: hypothetical protein U5K32_02680 [Bacteroidales bacterium]|nr:hypothetical protein [Bacteroidales bacterium]